MRPLPYLARKHQGNDGLGPAICSHRKDWGRVSVATSQTPVLREKGLGRSSGPQLVEGFGNASPSELRQSLLVG